MASNIDYWEKILENPSPAYRELFEEEKKYLISHISGDSKVLDVGCGDGRNVQTIFNVAQDVIGIDNEPRAVEDSKKVFAGVPSVKILLADVLKIPFPDKTFDVVTLMMTLVNLKEQKLKALQEMARVLKVDGKIIISVYSEDSFNQRMEMYKVSGSPIKNVLGTKVIFDIPAGANESEQFSKEEIEEMARKSGLKIIDCKKVDNIAYIAELVKI